MLFAFARRPFASTSIVAVNDAAARTNAPAGRACRATVSGRDDCGEATRTTTVLCEICREIVGRRRHIDEVHAGLAQAEQAAPDAMDGSAAGVDLAVLARHATERDEKLAVPGEHIPARVARQQLFKRSHDMRHQHERSADAVVILVTHEAADRIEEAP